MTSTTTMKGTTTMTTHDLKEILLSILLGTGVVISVAAVTVAVGVISCWVWP